MSRTLSRLREFLTRTQADLDKCMDFWLKNSHDEQYGGFFNCLDKHGKVYDDLKYGWLQGRQVWTYCHLYCELERFHKPEILLAAKKGGEFLMKFIKSKESNRCYFIVSREGLPVKVQKTIFTEVFYTMAMMGLARATGEQMYKTEMLIMMDQILRWVQVDDSEIGRPKLPGSPKSKGMAEPMMVLCLLEALQVTDAISAEKYKDAANWAVNQILMHIQREGLVILENISPEGNELPGCHGRHMNPGHAIECGWFLLEYADKWVKDKELQQKAINSFILKPFEHGWDNENNGLFYFLDADGYSPTQLEWSQKLWWPHNEALIAFLMAYSQTENQALLEKFATVFDYSFNQFSDQEHGEWYGYFNRDGKLNLDIKGGPFKGCFHTPRCLMMCEQMLQKLVAKQQDT